MGTRGLTMVVNEDGENKIAQYGQWDHYPSGNGLVCLEFLRDFNLTLFKEKLSRVRFLTNDDIINYNNYLNEINPEGGFLSNEKIDLLNKKYPYFSRNHGSYILQMIYDSNDNEILLSNNIEFATDSLFCEYGYLIDLKNNLFEIYKGFNNELLSDNERFKYLETDDEYKPIRLFKSYNLDYLPTNEQFLSDLQN